MFLERKKPKHYSTFCQGSKHRQASCLVVFILFGFGVCFVFYWCFELFNYLSSTLKLSTQRDTGSSGKYSTQLTHKRKIIQSAAICIPQYNLRLMNFNSKAEMKKKNQSLNLSTLANVSCGLLIYETIPAALQKPCLALNCKRRIITGFITGSSGNRSHITFLSIIWKKSEINTDRKTANN